MAATTSQAVPIRRVVGKTRNPWGVWLLSLVTLGVYGLWWYYTVNAELRDYNEQIHVQPGLSLVAIMLGWFAIFIIPIISWVRTGGRIAHGQRLAGSTARCSGLIGFLLAIVSFGMVYYQSQINKVWDMYGNPQPGTLIS
jgi:Domain of unknown function (DUF4234)